MARLFFSTTSGSLACPRCGNAILRDAQTCRHCGADLNRAQDDAGPSLASSLRLPFTARRYGALSAPYPSLAEASELGRRGQRRDLSKAIAIGGVAFALLAGGVIYYAQHGAADFAESEAAAGQSVSGPIDAKLVRDNTPAKTVAGVAAAMPAATAPAPPAPMSALAARSAAPAPGTPGVPARDATLASTIDNLQAARDAIERGDLTTARRRFSKIPAGQLEAGNVLRTQAELIRLEHARDDSLQFARACASTESWTCARQNARDVLAIDASNVEAQALVEQAIERSGWLRQTRPATTTRNGAPHAPLTSATRARAATVQAQAQPMLATAESAPAPVVLQQVAPVPLQTAQPARVIMDQPVMNQPVTTPAPSEATAAPAATPPLTRATVAADTPPAATAPSGSRPAFDATNPDDRERAILEKGWSKSPPPASQPPSQ